MNLSQNTYRTLIVSATDSFVSGITPLLPEARYHPIEIVNNIHDAQKINSDAPFDLILINAPLPQDSGIHFAVEANRSQNSTVLILFPAAIYDNLHDQISEYGIFTLPKPTSKATLVTALNWLCSAVQNSHRFQEKMSGMKHEMEETKLITQAKWLLINEYNMNENQAHHYLEKAAMNRCVTKKQIAVDLLKTQAPSLYNEKTSEPA